MTYASVLSQFTSYQLDAVLIISGIPVAFGTRAGRVHDGTGVNEPYPAPWTSVNAWDVRSFKQGESTMDKDGCYVRPSNISLELFLSSEWDRYFERRRTPQMYLTADLDETSTTITVNDTTGLDGGNYLYINRETILIGNVFSTTTLTGCTRNAIGLANDTAASHTLGTTCGVTPRNLLGREATLRVFVGAGDSDYQDFIGLKMVESPRHNRSRGVWELAFDDGMARFARKIAVGMQGTTIKLSTSANSGASYDLYWTDAIELGYFNANAALDYGHVILSSGDRGVSGALPLLSTYTHVTSGAIRVPSTIYQHPLSAPEGTGNPSSYDFMRRVYAFTGSPMEAALKVLLSDRGNGENDATYDVLAGPVSSTGGTTSDGRLTDGQTERRLGAAIPAALVDIATLTHRDLITRAPPGWFYVLGARGPENLLDFLEEVGWAMGGYWVPNAAGQLSFKLFDASYPTDVATATITEGDLIRDVSYVSVDDEKDMLHTVSIECNHGLSDDKPHGFFSAVAVEGRETYRDVPGLTRTLNRKGLLVKLDDQDELSVVRGGFGVGSPASRETVRTAMTRIYVYREKGTRKYIFDCPWKYSTLLAGDTITVTHSKFNAFDGNGLNGATLRVVSKAPDIAKQRVKITCEETWVGRMISPAARVTSWAWTGSGSLYTLTLTANAAKFNLGASPTSYFAAGWQLEVRQYPTFVTTGNVTVSSIVNATQMIVDGAPYATPAAKDMVCFRQYANASSAAANAAQGLGQRSYAFMAGSDFLLGGADAAYVWG